MQGSVRLRPQLAFSHLSGCVYIVKRGKAESDGRITATDKVDVTSDFEQIVLMRQAWKDEMEQAKRNRAALKEAGR